MMYFSSVITCATLASAQGWGGQGPWGGHPGKGTPYPGHGHGMPEDGATDALNYGYCADAPWPSEGPGNQLVPQSPDVELQQMLSEISPDRIQHTIEKLVSFGTRATLSEPDSTATHGIGGARDWLLTQYQAAAAASGGRMEARIESYIQQPDGERILFPVNISNVVATLTGSETPEKVFVISGHYDSRRSDVNDYTGDAPGADDDASGVAVSLELARIAATRYPRSTMVFMAVAGEEQGLYGSNYMAQMYKNNSVDVQAMLNDDTIGSFTGDRGQKSPNVIRLFAQGVPPTESQDMVDERLTIGGENDSPARELGRFSAEVGANKWTEMTIAVIYRLDRFLRGGDHLPFLEAGFPAIRYTEPHEIFEHQHQDVRVEDGVQYGDLIEFVDFEYTARVGKVNLATMWSLAQSPGWVRNVGMNVTDLSNDSILLWDALDDDGLAGYEVVWRPTDAPFWTHSIDVGDVTTATIPLSKDNAILGVRSVGKNGYKGPATIPFPVS